MQLIFHSYRVIPQGRRSFDRGSNYMGKLDESIENLSNTGHSIKIKL